MAPPLSHVPFLWPHPYHMFPYCGPTLITCSLLVAPPLSHVPFLWPHPYHMFPSCGPTLITCSLLVAPPLSHVPFLWPHPYHMFPSCGPTLITCTHTCTELSARCPSGVESAPDVTDLLNLVVPHIQGRLLEVGLQLGLTKEAVEAIATDPSGQHWTRVFTEWRERAVKPYTWATLLDMLESSEISYGQPAQVLRAMIAGGGAAGRERASSASKTEVDGPPAVEPQHTGVDGPPAVEPQGTGVASESLNTSTI